MITGILLVQAVAFAVLSGIVASNKNRDPAGWGIIGFLFGLFGFIAAVAVGEAEETQSSDRQGGQQSISLGFNPDEQEKKCPACAEYIKLEARVCKHCGHEFSEEEVEREIGKRKDELKRRIADADFYCQRNEKAVKSDGYTCPSCGRGIKNGRHSPIEEVNLGIEKEGGDEGTEVS